MTVRMLKNIINDPARYMSWESNAVTNSGPVVGSPSTIAVMVDPDTIVGNVYPMVLIIGLRAILMG